MDLASIRWRSCEGYLFISLGVWTRGHATDKKTWGTTSWGRGRRNRLKSVERGGETGGERRRCYHRCWIIEQCTPARSHIPTSIPTQFCPRYYCLLADCRVRSGGGKGGCAREDVSSRGSRGVNYFTILFEEARAWNLRNEIPRRLAETWLIFYRRPVYIYIGIRSLLRKFHLTFPPNPRRSRTSISTLAIF